MQGVRQAVSDASAVQLPDDSQARLVGQQSTQPGPGQRVIGDNEQAEVIRHEKRQHLQLGKVLPERGWF
jgi:hypothetical protein